MRWQQRTTVEGDVFARRASSSAVAITAPAGSSRIVRATRASLGVSEGRRLLIRGRAPALKAEAEGRLLGRLTRS